MADPRLVQEAECGEVPLARTKSRVPVRNTGSLNSMSMSTMLPARYEPFGVVEVTWLTVGARVSTMIDDEELIDPVAPGEGRAMTLSLRAVSLIELPAGRIKAAEDV